MARTKRPSPPKPVMTWTRFNLPVDEHLPYLDESSDEVLQGWKKFLHFLEEIVGRVSIWLGRIVEKSEGVLLITSQFPTIFDH